MIRDQLIKEADFLQRLTNPLCAHRGALQHIDQIIIEGTDRETEKMLSEQKEKIDRNAAYRLPLPDYPVTSVKSLDMAVEEQKRLNREYLQNRLKRCEGEVKEEFFNQYRNQLKEIEKALAEGKPLSQNQQMIKQFADTYGLKSDKRQEKLTPEQAKAREKLGIKDLPEEFQKKMKERT